MPIIVKTDVDFGGLGLPQIQTAPALTPMPELFFGIQFWFEPTLDTWENDQYPSSGNVYSAWNDQWYARLYDSSGGTGIRHPLGLNFAHRTNSANSGWPVYSDDGAHAVNNHPVIRSNGSGKVMFLGGQPGDSTMNASFAQSPHTTLLVYRADLGCLGGMIGSGASIAQAHDNSATGWRIGFRSDVNNAQTLYQNDYQSADRLLINRNTADGNPARLIAYGDSSGEVILKHGNTRTTHAFAFTVGPQDVSAGVSLGLVGVGDNALYNNIALCARWGRALASSELSYLESWIDDRFGPF